MNDFTRGFDEGYAQGIKKGYIQCMEENEEKELRPDYCPRFTPVEEIEDMICSNCLVESKCNWKQDFKITSEKEYTDYADFDDEDFDETDYEIEMLYNTEPIEHFQEIIEKVLRINCCIGQVRFKYFQDEYITEILDDVRKTGYSIIDELREMQEKAAVDEMYEFLCKNY